MKKSNYKDKEAKRKYMELYGKQIQEADDKKEDHRMKQAVRRGVIVRLPEKDPNNGGWRGNGGRQGELHKIWTSLICNASINYQRGISII